MRQLTNNTLLLIAVVLLGGCNSAPKKDPAFAPVAPVALPPKPEGNGAIFQAGYERSWFEDLRARRVGDILTVNLVEQTDAFISNSTEVTKSSTTNVTNPTLFGKPLSFTLPGGSPGATLGFDLQSSTDFLGEGDNEQRNALSGSVTVTVIEVLANGYLRVRGEKRIGTNGGNEYIKLSGIVRPEDIDPNNTIASTKVGDATLVYVGDGQVADANVMGWLARFFISAFVPF
jgi:flagellar L-ring protein precursor FlgH